MIRVKNLKRSGKGAPPSPAEPTPRNLDKPPEAEVKPKPARKARITVMISPEIARLARNVVWATPRLTMSALVEDALVREVQQLGRLPARPAGVRALPGGSGPEGIVGRISKLRKGASPQ